MAKELVFSVTAKDCDWHYFKSSGNGGQKRDKTDNCCRVTHPPSGAVGKSTEHRQQSKNRQAAFRKMAETPKFQAWARAMVANLPPIETVVDAQMAPENLKIEYL